MRVYRAFGRQVEEILRRGGVGVIPTDTIYGIVGSALNKKAVRRIYTLRRRSLRKPMIVLIGTLTHLAYFGIRLDTRARRKVQELWPGKVSVLLPCRLRKFFYLHRGTKTLAFRVPRERKLQRLLKAVGPLVAPSANWEDKPPARNIREAQGYFKRKVDFYVDGGMRTSLPSTLIEFQKGRVAVLRSGAVRI